METPVELVCAFCDQPFEKAAREHRRQIRKGRTSFYCGLSCMWKDHNRKHPPRGNPATLIAGNRRDEFTPFRWFLLRVRSREDRKGSSNLTLAYLKKVWATQAGRCPLTGWDLRLPRNTWGWPDGLTPDCASLDRIDNAKGYIKGNVRFLSVMANLARQSFSDTDVRTFATAVHTHAQVAESADAADSKSAALRKREGSSPFLSTTARLQFGKRTPSSTKRAP